VTESQQLIYELNEMNNYVDETREMFSTDHHNSLDDNSKSMTMWKMRHSAGTSIDNGG
jgi:hypothetical protein